VPAYGPQNDVTLKMPAFEWVHVQLHQQKGMISLSPPTICNSALIGLSDNWRVDSYMVAEHLLWLQQHYWQSRYSVSFPRLRPCTGGIEPASIMDERQLVQTICAFRLLAPEIELSLSTRESPWFRDRVIPLAINNVSAFSKTQPGGYADNHPELEQFSPHDDRRPEAVAAALTAQGLQPVWKDWDSYLGRASQRL
ncbi:hypothetical protein WMQ18_23220, partial [Escherichia coli]